MNMRAINSTHNTSFYEVPCQSRQSINLILCSPKYVKTWYHIHRAHLQTGLWHANYKIHVDNSLISTTKVNKWLLDHAKCEEKMEKVARKCDRQEREGSHQSQLFSCFLVMMWPDMLCNIYRGCHQLIGLVSEYVLALVEQRHKNKSLSYTCLASMGAPSRVHSNMHTLTCRLQNMMVAQLMNPSKLY